MQGIDEQSGPALAPEQEDRGGRLDGPQSEAQPQPEGTNAVNARSEEAPSATDARDCTPAVEDAETAAVEQPVETSGSVEETALPVSMD